jgi:hypothetical protein
VNIIPTIHDDTSDFITFIDELSGEIINKGMIQNNPDSEVAMNKKLEDLQASSDAFQAILSVLKEAPGFRQEEKVKMLAGAMLKLHNTDFASVVRTLRDALELVDKWKNGRQDLRNEAAFNWIRKGKDMPGIPFI